MVVMIRQSRAAIFMKKRGREGNGRGDCTPVAQKYLALWPLGLGLVDGGGMTWLRLLLVLVATVSLTACEAIGHIFQAGMAVGVIMVIFVIALIGFLVAKMRA